MYTSGLLGIIRATALYISLTSATIVLSDFQTVTGFPPACQNAYDAPISGCDASNFPQNCSEQCLYALAQAQATIDNACAGQQAPFGSIIGQMFQGDGPEFMCTENFGQGSSASSSSASYYGDSTSSLSSSTTTPSTSSTGASRTSETTTTESSSSSKSKSKLTTSTTVRRTSTVSARTSTASSASSTSASSSATSTTSASANIPPGSQVFVTTAFNNGVATTLTSQAQRTSAAGSNPDAFGGGGSPFEVGPNGNGGNTQAKARADFWLLLSVIFGVVLMR